MQNIDDFILSLKTEDVTIISTENPTSQQIQDCFVSNPNIKAVKYQYKFQNYIDNTSPNVIYDQNNNKYTYNHKISVLNTDVITNISNNTNLINLFFIFDAVLNCNTTNLTIPTIGMKYFPINFYIDLPNTISNDMIITYDVYVFSESIRKQLTNIKLVNNKGLQFINGMCSSSN